MWRQESRPACVIASAHPGMPQSEFLRGEIIVSPAPIREPVIAGGSQCAPLHPPSARAPAPSANASPTGVITKVSAARTSLG